jgi:uncharacterized membrane protein YdjX (TVP38/TMEM64 family)
MTWIAWTGIVVGCIGLSLLANALENRWAERRGRRPSHDDYGES